FSWQCGFGNFGTLFPSPSQLGIIGRICLSNFLTAWAHTSSGAHFLSDCVSPSLERSRGGGGISTCLPSPTAFGLGLGPDSPCADEPSSGNLRRSWKETP